MTMRSTLPGLHSHSALRQRGARRERILSTLLFAEGCESSDPTDGGEQARRDAVRRTLEVFDGHELKAADGRVVAVFDLPADAVRCALRLRDVLAERGSQLRAGVHTGVIEVRSGDPCGQAVQLCRRLVEAADPGEVVVTGVAAELSGGIRFEPRGTIRLRGLPGKVPVFGATESTDGNGSGRNPSGVWRANGVAGTIRVRS